MNKGAVVIYKNQPAIVTQTGEKYTIEFRTVPATATGKKAQYGTQNVREKDVTLLHAGPVASVAEVLAQSENSVITDDISAKLAETWELLASDGDTANNPISLQELAEYALGDFAPSKSWAFFKVLCDDIHFCSLAPETNAVLPLFLPRTESQIRQIQEQLEAKGKESQLHEEFIARLKQKQLDLPKDAKYMQEVESLALGHSDKSKVMKEAGFKETPERAHKLLLDTGIWTPHKNPYPTRRGVSMQSAAQTLPPPPDDQRLKVDHIAWAIDNEWSTDPDDAIAFDGEFVWVHVADPAAAVLPDSQIDKTARNRGSTLYIPEGAARMLSESSLADYALGLNDGLSKALSFKLKLDANGAIESCDVLKTLVKVERLTYGEADEKKDCPELAPLYEIAKRNIGRRKAAEAVFIDLPEVHISVAEKVSVVPASHPESSSVVREFMLLAGEGAAKFAFKNNIPFTYISQEKPDIPKDIPEGLAGQYRLRRSMRGRTVGIIPSQHAGLGLGMYSQVTSPLRRYSDLIAHQQLHAFLDERPLLDKDTMLERMSAGDAAAGATIKAARESDLHWTLVYLLENPDWTGEAVVVEQKGKMVHVLIPSLAQEADITPSKEVELNDVLKVKAGTINLTELQVQFIEI
ncbi:MAG: RNB domain-containing ribonuclease [Treponemataceae bacterium]|nr:RNB domain-containing ribonuclease [Treponemataceae bacterium]